LKTCTEGSIGWNKKADREQTISAILAILAILAINKAATTSF
jgi:hypothetical protein